MYPTTSTEGLRIPAGPLRRVTAATAATHAAVGSIEDLLVEAALLSRSLVAQAKHLDELRSQHGPELVTFGGGFAPIFEALEREVADLVRTGLSPRPDPALEDDHDRTASRSASWRKQ